MDRLGSTDSAARHRSWRRLGGALAAALAIAAALPLGLAAADATYQTERLPFAPVAGAPLKGGFVVNAHANGPQIYAHEQYVLLDAAPNTEYQVTLLGDLNSPTCATAADLTVNTATITTNQAGNGTANAVFTPADVAGLAGMTVGGRWQITAVGSPTVLYQTACTAITLD